MHSKMLTLGILILVFSFAFGVQAMADTVDSYTTGQEAPSSPASGWCRFDDTANSSKFYYNNISPWSNGDTTVFYNGNIHANGGSLSDNSKQSYIGFKISGTRFALIDQFNLARNQNIQVYIDGSYITTFSAPSIINYSHYVYYISPVLSDGYHTVWLVGPSFGSHSTEMNFDGIDIKDPTRRIGLVSAVTPSISTPSISTSRAGWGTDNVSVSIGGSSDASQTPATISYLYSIDNGSYKTYSGSFTVSGNGWHTIKAYAADAIGCTSATTSKTFGIDTTAPSVNGSEVATWSRTSATVNTSISDSYSGVAIQKWASGTRSASFFSSNGSTFTGTSFTVTSDGTYTVYARDNAGNSTVYPVPVSHIDTTAPSGSYSLSPSSVTSGSVKITVEATDSGSGVASITDPGGKVTSGTSAAYTVSENGTYQFVLKDNVGNASTFNVPVTNIDRTISVTHPVSVGYAINPNSSTPFSASDVTIKNNSAIPVKVSVQSLIAVSGIPDISPTKYADWNSLTAAQTEAGIALGIGAKSSSGWNSGYSTATHWATDANSLAVGTLNAGASGSLQFSAKYGLAWRKAFTGQSQLTLFFEVS